MTGKNALTFLDLRKKKSGIGLDLRLVTFKQLWGNNRNAAQKYDAGRLDDPKRKAEYSTKLRKSLQNLEHREESEY
ncbi:hypothetical protein BpHYR1_019230 [Brachionus plicatilis]|uniref:Uncharacterized protein n=1 Tax=Brachionus plicatilis TaxID=10195 RepID=A0A3M7QID4_BRAPC|nr:hypothetical protein BpHYR1_019230 [Brachionus plicatilis]